MNPRALSELLGAWRSQWWPAERMRSWQRRQLMRMLSHAATRVPYYRLTGLNTHGLSPEAALAGFPCLTKSDMQAAGDLLLADGFRRDGLRRSRTSGSSGEPTTTWFDEDAWRFTRHVLKWRRVLATVQPWGVKLLAVTEEGATAELIPGPRVPGVLDLRSLSIAAPADAALDAVRRFRPTAIYAFPSWLRELVETARERGIELPTAECVMTSSEVLTSADRQVISQAFSAPVRDVYGSTEFKEVAWQCDAGRYHINVESVWVEVDALPGEVGEIVLTGLVNRAMPLVRFRTGDLGRLISGLCACGRESPALEDIQGRVTEMIDLPGGRRLSPYLLTTSIETDRGVRNYVIEQHATDRLIIRYRARLGLQANEEAIARKVRDVVGPGVEVTCRSDAGLYPPGCGKRSVYRRLSPEDA